MLSNLEFVDDELEVEEAEEIPEEDDEEEDEAEGEAEDPAVRFGDELDEMDELVAFDKH